MYNDEGSSRRPAFIRPYHFHLGRNNKWVCDLCTGANKKRKPMTYRDAIQHERNSTDHTVLVNSTQHVEQEQHDFGWHQPSNNPWDPQGPPLDAWAQPTKNMNDDAFLTRETMRGKQHQLFADQVHDRVPFWIRGVEAAERGEELRLEDFLNSLETETWPPRGHNPWANADHQSIYGGRVDDAAQWGQGWGAEDELRKWGASEVEQEAKPEVSSASAVSYDRTMGSNDFRSSMRAPSGEGARKRPRARELVEIVARQEAVGGQRKQDLYSFLELPTDGQLKKIDDLINTLRSHP